MNRQGTQDLGDSEATLHAILMMDTIILIYLLKPIKCRTPRMNAKVHYGLRVITLWHWEMLMTGKAMQERGRAYGKPPCLPLNSASNLKLL